MWSVVKPRQQCLTNSDLQAGSLLWLRTTVKSFFLKCLESSHRRIETRYDTRWVVEKISVSVPRYSVSFRSRLRTETKRRAVPLPMAFRNVAAEKIISVTKVSDVRPWMKQKCLNHHFFTKYPTQCPSWLYCWSRPHGGAHGRSRSLGRSCQETRRYRRVDGA